MGKIAFIGWLFITSFAFLGLGFSNTSLGQFIVGIILLFVAIYAFRQGKQEMVHGRNTVSDKFVINAILVMLACIAAMAFFFTTVNP